MEPAVLSRWKLEFQSILLAAAFRVWRLVRAGRNNKMPLNSQSARPAQFRDCLPDLCSRDDNGRTLPGVRENAPNVAVRRLQSQRQDKSRPVSRSALNRHRIYCDAICIEGLAWAGMANLPANNQMRRT